MTLGEIAKALEPASKLLRARAPGLSADGWFFSDHMTYPYGVNIAVAMVDRETGGGEIGRFLFAYYVGGGGNTMLIVGELAGGVGAGGGGGGARGMLLSEGGGAAAGEFVD